MVTLRDGDRNRIKRHSALPPRRPPEERESKKKKKKTARLLTRCLIPSVLTSFSLSAVTPTGPGRPRRRGLRVHLPRLQPQEVRGQRQRRRGCPPGGRPLGGRHGRADGPPGGRGGRRRPDRPLCRPGRALPLAPAPGGRGPADSPGVGGGAGGPDGVRARVAGDGDAAGRLQCVVWNGRGNRLFFSSSLICLSITSHLTHNPPLLPPFLFFFQPPSRAQSAMWPSSTPSSRPARGRR